MYYYGTSDSARTVQPEATRDPDSDQDQGRTVAVGGCSLLVDTDWRLGPDEVDPDEALEMAMALWDVNYMRGQWRM